MDPYIRIVAPKEDSNVPASFRISTEISSSEKIKKVRFYLDGSEVGSDTSSPFGFTFNLNTNQFGSHKFKAKATDDNDNEGEHEVTLNVISALEEDK
jgi:hypothetical protein